MLEKQYPNPLPEEIRYPIPFDVVKIANSKGRMRLNFGSRTARHFKLGMRYKSAELFLNSRSSRDIVIRFREEPPSAEEGRFSLVKRARQSHSHTINCGAVIQKVGLEPGYYHWRYFDDRNRHMIIIDSQTRIESIKGV